MTDQETRELYLRAYRKWGEAVQIATAIEEFSELITELARLLCGRGTWIAVAEELADAQIMLEQLLAMGATGEMVASAREEKLARLKKRIEGTDK